MTFRLEDSHPKDFWRWKMHKTHKGQRYFIGKTVTGPAYWIEAAGEVDVCSSLEEAEDACKKLIECDLCSN
jgi:hypothetical protein